MLERSGYLAELQASEDLQDASRIENLNELVSVAREFDALGIQSGLADPDSADGAGPGRARSRTSWSRCPSWPTPTRSPRGKTTAARSR